MPKNDSQPAQTSRVPSRLEREETKLWRMVLAFLVLLATAVAALSWERLQSLPYSLLAIPVGLLALAFLFASYAYGRHKEVANLKILLKGLEERTGVAPSE